MKKIEITSFDILKILKPRIVIKGNNYTNKDIFIKLDDDFIKRFEIRKLIVDNYIVFYRIQNINIQIARIMYGKRNWINFKN